METIKKQKGYLFDDLEFKIQEKIFDEWLEYERFMYAESTMEALIGCHLTDNKSDLYAQVEIIADILDVDIDRIDITAKYAEESADAEIVVKVAIPKGFTLPKKGSDEFVALKEAIKKAKELARESAEYVDDLYSTFDEMKTTYSEFDYRFTKQGEKLPE